MLNSLASVVRHAQMLERAFDRPLYREYGGVPANATHFPYSDVIETGDNWLITMELPGVDKSDVSVNVEGGYIKISAKRERDTSHDDDMYLRREISYGLYERTFKIGRDLQVDKIKASMDNGILKITIPKELKTAQNSIEVKIS